MGIEATGKIHRIGETQQVSERFSKRELVLEMADNPKYVQHVAFEFTNDKCSELDDYSVGDSVRVEFSLRGREWRSPKGEVKYFNTLSLWSIEHVGERKQTRRLESSGSGRVDAPPIGPDDDIPFATADMSCDPSPIARVIR